MSSTPTRAAKKSDQDEYPNVKTVFADSDDEDKPYSRAPTSESSEHEIEDALSEDALSSVSSASEADIDKVDKKNEAIVNPSSKQKRKPRKQSQQEQEAEDAAQVTGAASEFNYFQKYKNFSFGMKQASVTKVVSGMSNKSTSSRRRKVEALRGNERAASLPRRRMLSVDSIDGGRMTVASSIMTDYDGVHYPEQAIGGGMLMDSYDDYGTQRGGQPDPIYSRRHSKSLREYEVGRMRSSGYNTSMMWSENTESFPYRQDYRNYQDKLPDALDWAGGTEAPQPAYDRGYPPQKGRADFQPRYDPRDRDFREYDRFRDDRDYDYPDNRVYRDNYRDDFRDDFRERDDYRERDRGARRGYRDDFRDDRNYREDVRGGRERDFRGDERYDRGMDYGRHEPQNYNERLERGRDRAPRGSEPPAPGAGGPQKPGTAQNSLLKHPDDESFSTVMVRNIPNDYTRKMLVDLITSKNFKGGFDFLYYPLDLYSNYGLGYAFINFVDRKSLDLFWKEFEGFSDWGFRTKKVCAVCWAQPNQQGLESNITRYRNSQVMHESVFDEGKPMLFENGNRIPFPPPTGPLTCPKVRKDARRPR